MKVSYSKLLVHGVIATTLLMSMSCQKKGSARVIQPQTQTKAGGQDLAPNAGDPSQVEGTPALAMETSKDGSAVESNNAPPATVNAEKEAQPAVTKVKECSDDVVAAQQEMTALYNKIGTVDKVSTTTDDDKKSNYTAYYNLCLSWTKIFVTENIVSCIGESMSGGDVKPIALTPDSWLTSCYKYGSALKELTGKTNYYSEWAEKYRADRIVKLKATKFEISEEAKEMFTTENTAWKMFLVDGEIQTDAAKLTDAIKAGKVACTITSESKEKLTDSHNVIVSITQVSALVSTKATDEVQKGMELTLSIRAVLKDTSAEDNVKVNPEISKMTCSNLDIKDVNLHLLEKAIGKHFKIQKAPATAKDAAGNKN